MNNLAYRCKFYHRKEYAFRGGEESLIVTTDYISYELMQNSTPNVYMYMYLFANISVCFGDKTIIAQPACVVMYFGTSGTAHSCRSFHRVRRTGFNLTGECVLLYKETEIYYH